MLGNIAFKKNLLYLGYIGVDLSSLKKKLNAFYNEQNKIFNLSRLSWISSNLVFIKPHNDFEKKETRRRRKIRESNKSSIKISFWPHNLRHFKISGPISRQNTAIYGARNS